MKNKLGKNILFTTLALLFSSANVVFAIDNSAIIKSIMSKYATVLGVLVVFFICLTLGLSLYNRFFVSEEMKEMHLRKDSLKTPESKDEAISIFISKNKM